jgi:rod shape determining protein RodA
MLVLVHGRNVGGNQAWISLGGGFRLQPSEFAKFSTCLLLARYLSGTNIKVTELKSFAYCGGDHIFPMFLIMLQPDAGSTLVFSCAYICFIPRRAFTLFFNTRRFVYYPVCINLKLNNLTGIIGALVVYYGHYYVVLFRRKKLVSPYLLAFAICIALFSALSFYITMF